MTALTNKLGSSNQRAAWEALGALQHAYRRRLFSFVVMASKFLILMLVLGVVLLSGCVSAGKRTDLTESEAVALAVRLANQEARQRFRVEPFREDSGHLVFRDGRWCWQALTNARGRDAMAKIGFDRDGSRPQIYVDMQFSAAVRQR